MTKTISLALALLMVFMCAACSGSAAPKPNEPASILARFEKANNDRDMQALLNCYDPDFVAFIQGIAGIVGGVFGMDKTTDAMNALLPYLSKAFQEYVQSNDTYPTIRLSEISTTMNGDNKATVRYTETLVYPNGSEKSSEQSMAVTKVNGTWYISVSFSPNQSINLGPTIETHDPDMNVEEVEVVIYSSDAYDIVQRPYLYTVPDVLTVYGNGGTGADLRFGIVRQSDIGTTPITETIFDAVGQFSEGLCAVSAYDSMSGESKWGFIDETGALVVPHKYDEVGAFSSGYAKVRIGRGNNIRHEKWGFVDTAGKEVIPVEYSLIREDTLKDGYLTVGIIDADNQSANVSYKFGKYDIENGKLVIPTEYREVFDFSEGLCSAHYISTINYEQEIHYYDVSGNIVLQKPLETGFRSGELVSFQEGRAIFLTRVLDAINMYKDAFYFVNTNGEQIGGTFDDAQPFQNGYAVVQGVNEGEIGRSSYGYIDTSINLVIPYKFYMAYPFENGLAIVNMLSETNNTTADYHFINENGDMLTDYTLDVNSTRDYYNSPWKDGVKIIYCDAGEGYNWGIIDENARLIASNFANIGGVSEGLIAVQKQSGNKWGYISAETGETVIPYLYDYAGAFSGGVAFARTEDSPDTLLSALGMTFYPLCLIDNAGAHLTDYQYVGVATDANGKMSLSQNTITPFTDGKAVVALANPDGSYAFVELEIVRK